MNGEDALLDLIDLTYEAVLDADLWPLVLTKLADVMGASQIAMATLDRRAQTFGSIAPRTDPDRIASYQEYWAFHNPLWTQTTTLPVGEIFTLDKLMARGDFAKTPIFNEWWRPAEYGLAMLGANLVVEKDVSALICAVDAPQRDGLGDQQARIFKSALRHIDRAVRIQRRLWMLDLDRDSAVDQFETLPEAIFLVDAGARIQFANGVAKELLDGGGEFVLQGGCLGLRGGAGTLHGLIASCAPRSGLLSGSGFLAGPGGEFAITRGPRKPALRVLVAPLRSKGRIPDVPWLGLRAPVAIVTVTDPESDRRRLELQLRETFGLTPAESGLATEIVKGDGRKAAAQRRGIAVSTARAQLSSIFDKTGTHRQAELVRLLHDVAARTEPRG